MFHVKQSRPKRRAHPFVLGAALILTVLVVGGLLLAAFGLLRGWPGDVVAVILLVNGFGCLLLATLARVTQRR